MIFLGHYEETHIFALILVTDLPWKDKIFIEIQRQHRQDMFLSAEDYKFKSCTKIATKVERNNSVYWFISNKFYTTSLKGDNTYSIHIRISH